MNSVRNRNMLIICFIFRFCMCFCHFFILNINIFRLLLFGLVLELAKNTSLPFLFYPLTLALSILILFLKTKPCPFLDLHSIYLLTACFKKKNFKLFCSFCILLSMFSLYFCCVNLTETCHSTCISLLCCCFYF